MAGKEAIADSRPRTLASRGTTSCADRVPIDPHTQRLVGAPDKRASQRPRQTASARSAALLIGLVLAVPLVAIAVGPESTGLRASENRFAVQRTPKTSAASVASKHGPSATTSSGSSPVKRQASAQRIQGDIGLSSRTIHRWNEGNTQISLATGDCQLTFEGKVIKADKVLVVTDGPRGRVRNRLVIEGSEDSTSGTTPMVATLMSDDEPMMQAEQYRAKPSRRPFLMEYLRQAGSTTALASPRRIGSATQVPSHSQADVPTPMGGPVVQTPFTSDGSRRSEAVPAQHTLPQTTVHGAGVPSAGGAAANLLPVPDPTVHRNATPSLDSLELTSPSGVPMTGQVYDFPTTRYSSPTETIADPGGSQFLFGGGTKGLGVSARHPSSPPRVDTIIRPETNDTIAIGRGGVVLTVRDVAAQFDDGRMLNFGTVTISADRFVAWLPNMTDVINGTADLNSGDGELYIEGDIVFRAGDSLIYAEAMYYNIVQETGMVLDAEAISTVPEYQGVVRLKAEVLQQVSRGNFRAFDAAVTSSRLGVPRYWLQSERLDFFERTRSVYDQDTNQLVADTDPFVRSRNSFVFLGGVPVFYWPRFATSLERPVFYIKGIKVRNDQNFGSQVLLDWDVFQLLGIENIPEGVDWEFSTDYMSDRGPALGTNFKYDVPGMFGVPGRSKGIFDAWAIDDDGVDRLGRGRLEVTPEETFRGRALLRHRQTLASGWEWSAQLGWLSDRNFLEQYLESEWDQDPDHTTELRLQKYYYNQLFELSVTPQVNDFYQKTERLPEFNHYLFGGSLLSDRLTWQMHNHASYSRLNVADDPIDPTEQANHFPLPGEIQSQGVVASTRQELALDLNLGPFGIRPVASFEAAHYGEAADGDSLTRLLGQSGIQMNLPMVRVDPTIQSTLLNMRGLAHKMDWRAEYWYADSNTDLDELPYYDPLDDDAQEQFRRRFIGTTFGGVLPDPFDPRSYAYRQGIQRWMTSPSDVVADDLQQIRLGLNQRFQTKRGLPGQDRIVDILQLDIETVLFPRQDRDNFGETLGPTMYDFRYHIGDRLSLVSDGYLDFFPDGLRSLSAGIRSSRPGVSDWYVGMMSMEGPISSTVFRSNFDYRVNEKWIVSGGTTYDFGNTGYVGQNFGLTRIGESLLLRLNVNVDRGRDNVSFGFQIEPRFFARTLGGIGGGMIPPPGIEGLE